MNNRARLDTLIRQLNVPLPAAHEDWLHDDTLALARAVQVLEALTCKPFALNPLYVDDVPLEPGVIYSVGVGASGGGASGVSLSVGPVAVRTIAPF